jgi:hypothetical protein
VGEGEGKVRHAWLSRLSAASGGMQAGLPNLYTMLSCEARQACTPLAN